MLIFWFWNFYYDLSKWFSTDKNWVNSEQLQEIFTENLNYFKINFAFLSFLYSTYRHI